jgi:flagellar biosynthetic protein FliR
VEELSAQAAAGLLISLRIAPTLAFSPPFTLMRIPASVRLLLAVGISLWLVAAYPAQTWQARTGAGSLAAVVASELFLGISLALALQLAFAALLTAGRAVDIQAGFGFASLVDPGTRAQLPLTGMLISYAAAILFFASDGPVDLLAIWAMSVAEIPLGTAAAVTDNLGVILAYVSAIFVMAFGAVGLLMLVLFLVDLAIAFMSRTMPQMNVLLLGFQVKTIVTLILLPVAISLASALFLRMMRFALETATRMA